MAVRPQLNAVGDGVGVGVGLGLGVGVATATGALGESPPQLEKPVSSATTTSTGKRFVFVNINSLAQARDPMTGEGNSTGVAFVYLGGAWCARHSRRE
jgi:hypothetical protein